jgi:hypothetical protein
MQHLLLPITPSYLSLITRLEAQYVYAISIDGDEILLIEEEEAVNMRLPKLKAFMPEQQFLVIVGYINDLNIVSIHENGFVRNHQLFKLSLLPDDEDSCVVNV